MGRPSTVDRRRVLDAIFYVTATGCQWRALPGEYPNWNTVHRLHLTWRVTERGNRSQIGYAVWSANKTAATPNRRRSRSMLEPCATHPP